MFYRKEGDELKLISETADYAMKENIRSVLKSLGLTSSATSAFLALVSRPYASATTICNEARIPDSKVYYALEELRSKGMITVQYGTPNLYKALSPKEALANLKKQLTQEHMEKIQRADDLAEKLEAVHARAQGSDEVELAYIIKGRRNVLGKMTELIANAKKEITALISDKNILEEMTDPLRRASERGVEVGLAIPLTQVKKAGIKGIGEVKRLICECCVLVSDRRTLLVISSWRSSDMHAMMTQDRSLITMTLQNFTNPTCCTRT